MATAHREATARRIGERTGRAATVLENGTARAVVEDDGGMVSELSARRGTAYVNAHWIPPFRSNPGDSYDHRKHARYWKAKLLFRIAGNFPCAPNFGPAAEFEGVMLPPHGWTANEAWSHGRTGADAEARSAWALSRMESPAPTLPLEFRKIDAVFSGHSAHYVSLSVRNRGTRPLDINIGWHNTVGAPFLEAGCRVSACADRWGTVPAGSEFDETGRLAVGVEFDSLSRAPTRAGGICDISEVPPPIGFTDFATGAVPRSATLGWSAVANPAQGLVYACFFPGPAAAGEDGIALSFNDLWMQYGGRPFTPWAAYDGGTDLAYCLGTEQAIGAYANGLAYSRRNPRVLGAPTTVTIPEGSTRTLRYGTLFAPYDGGALDGGVSKIEGDDGVLVLSGQRRSARFPADPLFASLVALERQLAD